jgi:hypothetical protein
MLLYFSLDSEQNEKGRFNFSGNNVERGTLGKWLSKELPSVSMDKNTGALYCTLCPVSLVLILFCGFLK